MKELLKQLDALKIKHDADCCVVNFINKTNFCIRIIKDGKIIKRYQRRLVKKEKKYEK